MRITGRNLLAAAAAAALLALAGCATTTSRPAPGPEVPYPSPLSGPGLPPLDAQQREAVEAGVRHLAAGKPAEAAQAASAAGDVAAAKLLALQAAAVVTPTPAETEALERLTSEHPDYAAAWITLSQVAEKTGDESRALHAAQRGAELWSSRPWRERAAELHARLVDERLVRARQLAGGTEPTAALPDLDAVLALEPDNTDARILKAEVLLAAGRTVEAAPLLTGLDSPRARLLDGKVAAAQGDWTAAMSAFQSLPAGFPGRDAALAEARLRWRISNLPPYVGQAIAAATLDRSQLAILLVDLAPQVEGVASGRAPLLSDIVDLPSYREILTAVSTGLLHADLLEHRFHPERSVSPSELKTALRRLSQLLGVVAPAWCSQPETADCTPVPDPPSGEAVTDLILKLVAEASS